MSRSLRGHLIQFFGGKDRNSSSSSSSNEYRGPAGTINYHVYDNKVARNKYVIVTVLKL